jgi:NADH-quinone oxidoreductase subunit M
MPPMGGFSSKWVIYTSLIQGKFYFLLIGMIISSTAAFLYCYKLIYGIFLGHPSKVKLDEVKEVSKPVWVSQIVLMIILMVLGMFPGLVVPYIAKAVAVVYPNATITTPSIYVLGNSLGGFNGFIVMNVLGGVFVVALIFFTIATVKSRKVHRLDIYYAAETPTEDTPLHYGNGIGAELHRVPVIGSILAKHVGNFYNGFANQVEGVADLLRGIYNGNGQTYVLYSVIVLVLLMVFLG